VSEELDGRLSEFEHVLLQEHLKTCGSCAGFRVSALRITSELRSAPLEQLTRQIAVVRLRRRMSLRAAPAIAALALGAVGLGSLLTSAVVRPGSEAEAPPSRAAQELLPENGPVNLGMLEGMRREGLVTPNSSVSAERLNRLLNPRR
jgi:predicted anti-sigma-YlaC factor YlaD